MKPYPDTSLDAVITIKEREAVLEQIIEDCKEAIRNPLQFGQISRSESAVELTEALKALVVNSACTALGD